MQCAWIVGTLSQFFLARALSSLPFFKFWCITSRVTVVYAVCQQQYIQYVEHTHYWSLKDEVQLLKNKSVEPILDIKEITDNNNQKRSLFIYGTKQQPTSLVNETISLKTNVIVDNLLTFLLATYLSKIKFLP